MRGRFLILIFVILSVVGCLGQDGCFLYATDLRVDFQSNPLGMDDPNPRLSWILAPANETCRNMNQIAYRVLVASATDIIDKDSGDYWDSNEITSNNTINILYSGVMVPSRTRVYWKVIIWDNNKNEWNKYNSDNYGWWETPLLNPSDWTAKWIQRYYSPEAIPSAPCDFYNNDPVPLFRKEFTLGATVISRARLYITALGYYEAFINGQKVGTNVLDPGFTTYNQTILYSTYDVSDLVTSNINNTIGIILGNGWYNPLPMLMFGQNLREELSTGFPNTVLAQLTVDFVDGSSYTLATDDSWQVGQGPILFNNIYLGERYNASLQQDGWTETGFDSSSWPAAVYNVQNGKASRLVAQYAPPIRMGSILPVVDSWPIPSQNGKVYDLGKNFAGWIQLNVSNAKPNQTIYMKYGEILFSDGSVNGLTTVAAQIKGPGVGGPCAPVPAFQTDSFTVKGLQSPQIETYQPMFTWHAFRYVEITTDTGVDLPTEISLFGIPLHSDLDQIGSFECSNSLFNSIQTMVVNTILSNMFSIQSDCPGRERFGYGGDVHASNKMVMYNFDMSNFYRKRVQDYEDASNYITLEYGYEEVIMPETAPFIGFASSSMGNLSGPIGWGTMFPQLQYLLYQFTGDTTLLKAQYDKSKGWLQFLSNYANNHGGVIDIGLGDWMAVDMANVNFTSNIFYRYNFVLMSQIAEVLGLTEDQEAFAEQADLIKGVRMNVDYMKESVIYDDGSQGAQSFALWHDLVPHDLTGYALGGLVDSVTKADNHITTGMFAILLETLSEMGRADLAFEMINQTSYPGFGYMIVNGSTTISLQLIINIILTLF